MHLIKAMIIAGLGGFAGTCLRFLSGRMCAALFGNAFPWGTLAVNLAGSFLIGILFGLAEKTSLLPASMSVFLITGFCGGLTTFSTLADDMYLMLEQHRFLSFGAYAAATFLLGLMLVWLGRMLVRA